MADLTFERPRHPHAGRTHDRLTARSRTSRNAGRDHAFYSDEARVLVDNNLANIKKTIAGGHEPPLLRGRRSAPQDLLRSRKDHLCHRHLRRPLSGLQRRHPRHRHAGVLPLRRAAHSRHPLRLRGPHSGATATSLINLTPELRRATSTPSAALPSAHPAARRIPSSMVDRLAGARRSTSSSSSVATAPSAGAWPSTDEAIKPGYQTVGGRHPQDDRQRHDLHGQELRLRHRLCRGRGGHQCRPHRGPQRAQRHRPGPAHGPPSGFIACSAAIASGEANCVLIPEVPFVSGRRQRPSRIHLASASSSAATPWSSSPKAPGKTSSPATPQPMPPATKTWATSVSSSRSKIEAYFRQKLHRADARSTSTRAT